MRYIAGFLVIIGLIVLVFILVMRGLSGNSKEETQAPLSNYATTDTIVRLTVDGSIVSDQEHRAYRITVGRSEVRMETLKGYQYEHIDEVILSNNEASYTNFLRALEAAGYTRGRSDADGEQRDERGMCAHGNRYVMEIISGTTSIQRYWSSQCRSDGTFKGNTSEVRRLFNAQIPSTDFRRLTRGLVL